MRAKLGIPRTRGTLWGLVQTVVHAIVCVRTSQKCLSDGVAALESATHLANQLSLFSDNEQVEEVATASLK